MKENKKEPMGSFYLIDSKNIGKHGKDIENTPFIFRIFLVLKYFRKEDCNEINAKRN